MLKVETFGGRLKAKHFIFKIKANWVNWDQAWFAKGANERWDDHFKIRQQQTRISSKEMLHHMRGNSWRFTVSRHFLRHTVRFEIPTENSHECHKTILSALVFASVGFSSNSHMWTQSKSRQTWSWVTDLYFVNIFYLHWPIKAHIHDMDAQASLCP